MEDASGMSCFRSEKAHAGQATYGRRSTTRAAEEMKREDVCKSIGGTLRIPMP